MLQSNYIGILSHQYLLTGKSDKEQHLHQLYPGGCVTLDHVSTMAGTVSVAETCTLNCVQGLQFLQILSHNLDDIKDTCTMYLSFIYESQIQIKKRKESNVRNNQSK